MNHHPKSPLAKLSHRLHSNTWQTILVVFFIVFVSVMLSLWLFWRSLYLPELKSHASYLASELKLFDEARSKWADNPETLAWLENHSHIQLIDDPSQFPDVTDKFFAGHITDILAQEVQNELGREVKVYFKFKPTPKLWVQDSKHPDVWLREPVAYYSQYSTGLLVVFLLGLPVLTLLTIFVLVRGLNRPLKRLEKAAIHYIQDGHATTLATNKGPREIRRVNTAFNQLFTTLSQAQKERTIMLAGISHDLRTPLTRMRLTAEMLPDEFFREGLVYDIEDMDAILEQFISFMKDGSDEAVRPTNLNTIFKEVMVQFSGTRFILESQIDQDVSVRPLSIKRLIINLVNNAIRYGREPIHLGASIAAPVSDVDDEFSLDQPHAKYPMLIIYVKDEGDGVAEDQLERIMQPFERGETARTTQGSGLGLAIVSRIARLHQGTVEAMNHPDGGLYVCVKIPLITQIVNDHEDEE
ncbi:ATP-binding protein [Moraxella nasibovis]|uniref:ATP-binding protein n=1 Tax=Moraxella nasibovis TaxID=2904120 RepID=UPI00240F5038|nr:ATP-binding protein [Moraxella nasibovis]WFF38967.1 ATP-binding protein [Moraxella nasibovis]